MSIMSIRYYILYVMSIMSIRCYYIVCYEYYEY